MLAGDDGQADDGILVDPHEATRLTHPTTFLQMLEDGQGFVLGQFGAIQGCTFAFGEPFLTGATGQDATRLVGAIAEAHPQVALATLAVIGTIGIQAAEVFQVVHDASSPCKKGEKVAEQLLLA